MPDDKRIMSEKPLNAETLVKHLRSWVTANDVFFDRNQGQIPGEKIALDQWALTIDGEVKTPLRLTFDQIYRRPKTIVANTMECSGNGRSLLARKASGNPWTIGGVGNAVWGGVALSVLLDEAGLGRRAAHVSFEGMDTPLGRAQVSFVRSIPIEKAMASTLLAYEMNGTPLPLKNGYPLRALALGWTGANCIKWLQRITVLGKPHEGFFMDKVYRLFQKGQDPKTGDIVTGIKLKSIITQPLTGEQCRAGRIVVLGAAYAGEGHVAKVEVSTDGGSSWLPAEWIGPDERYAWRQWQYIWNVVAPGDYTLLSRATDSRGIQQPARAEWNVLGYGNNGVKEHAVTIEVV